jgi:hypothetical protein
MNVFALLVLILMIEPITGSGNDVITGTSINTSVVGYPDEWDHASAWLSTGPFTFACDGDTTAVIGSPALAAFAFPGECVATWNHVGELTIVDTVATHTGGAIAFGGSPEAPTLAAVDFTVAGIYVLCYSEDGFNWVEQVNGGITVTAKPLSGVALGQLTATSTSGPCWRLLNEDSLELKADWSVGVPTGELTCWENFDEMMSLGGGKYKMAWGLEADNCSTPTDFVSTTAITPTYPSFTFPSVTFPTAGEWYVCLSNDDGATYRLQHNNSVHIPGGPVTSSSITNAVAGFATEEITFTCDGDDVVVIGSPALAAFVPLFDPANGDCTQSDEHVGSAAFTGTPIAPVLGAVTFTAPGDYLLCYAADGTTWVQALGRPFTVTEGPITHTSVPRAVAGVPTQVIGFQCAGPVKAGAGDQAAFALSGECGDPDTRVGEATVDASFEEAPTMGPITFTVAGTYVACYGSDWEEQNFGGIIVSAVPVAADDVASLSVASAVVGSATDVITITETDTRISAGGAERQYKLAFAPDVDDCATPANFLGEDYAFRGISAPMTSPFTLPGVVFPAVGTYQLCLSNNAGSDWVAQNMVITSVEGPITSTDVTEAEVGTPTAETITFRCAGDAQAADGAQVAFALSGTCATTADHVGSGVLDVATNGAVAPILAGSITFTVAGSYVPCYSADGSTWVEQVYGGITVTPVPVQASDVATIRIESNQFFSAWYAGISTGSITVKESGTSMSASGGQIVMAFGLSSEDCADPENFVGRNNMYPVEPCLSGFQLSDATGSRIGCATGTFVSPYSTCAGPACVEADDTDTCCVASITGRCEGNTNTSEDIDCSAGDGYYGGHTYSLGQNVALLGFKLTEHVEAECCEARNDRYADGELEGFGIQYCWNAEQNLLQQTSYQNVDCSLGDGTNANNTQNKGRFIGSTIAECCEAVTETVYILPAVIFPHHGTYGVCLSNDDGETWMRQTNDIITTYGPPRGDWTTSTTIVGDFVKGQDISGAKHGMTIGPGEIVFDQHQSEVDFTCQSHSGGQFLWCAGTGTSMMAFALQGECTTNRWGEQVIPIGSQTLTEEFMFLVGQEYYYICHSHDGILWTEASAGNSYAYVGVYVPEYAVTPAITDPDVRFLAGVPVPEIHFVQDNCNDCSFKLMAFALDGECMTNHGEEYLVGGVEGGDADEDRAERKIYDVIFPTAATYYFCWSGNYSEETVGLWLQQPFYYPAVGHIGASDLSDAFLGVATPEISFTCDENPCNGDGTIRLAYALPGECSTSRVGEDVLGQGTSLLPPVTFTALGTYAVCYSIDGTNFFEQALGQITVKNTPLRINDVASLSVTQANQGSSTGEITVTETDGQMSTGGGIHVMAFSLASDNCATPSDFVGRSNVTPATTFALPAVTFPEGGLYKLCVSKDDGVSWLPQTNGQIIVAAQDSCTVPIISAGVAMWSGTNCASGANGVPSGTECIISSADDYVCTSPGLCTDGTFAATGSCTESVQAEGCPQVAGGLCAACSDASTCTILVCDADKLNSDSDASNGCEDDCPAVTGGTCTACSDASTCTAVTCDDSKFDNDRDATTGCEASEPCASLVNGFCTLCTSVEASGCTELTCSTGFLDINGNSSDGCEGTPIWDESQQSTWSDSAL